MAVDMVFHGTTLTTPTVINYGSNSAISQSLTVRLPSGVTLSNSDLAVEYLCGTNADINTAWFVSSGPSGYIGQYAWSLNLSIAASTDGSNFSTIYANTQVHEAPVGPQTYDYYGEVSGGYFFKGGSPNLSQFAIVSPVHTGPNSTLLSMLSPNYTTYYFRCTFYPTLRNLTSGGSGSFTHVTVQDLRLVLTVNAL